MTAKTSSSHDFLALPDLAKQTAFKRNIQLYYLRHIRAIEAHDFVAQLCQAAYDMGCEDTMDDLEGLM